MLNVNFYYWESSKKVFLIQSILSSRQKITTEIKVLFEEHFIHWAHDSASVMREMLHKNAVREKYRFK